MKRVLAILARIFAFLALGVAVVLAQGAYFYKAPYQAPPVERPQLREILSPTPLSNTPSETSAKPEQRKGRVLVDLSHSNNFELQEISTLFVKTMSFGYTISYLEESKDLRKELGLPPEEPDKTPAPTDADKKKTEKKEPDPASALVIIIPDKRPTAAEAKAIKEFVEKGGRLLMIAEPSRPGELGWLSSQFGLIFEADYLYNTRENDGNFRNIFVTNFADSVLTRGLKKIAFYTAGSISPGERGIAFAGENTFSSLAAGQGKLSPLALTEDSKVLAIADITIFSRPYDAAFDNSHLISNIAGWITGQK